MYQLHHRNLGLYQGSFLGLGFWWPVRIPEEDALWAREYRADGAYQCQGICPFETEADAQEFIQQLCSAETPFPYTDPTAFSVEPYDAELSAQMEREGLARLAAEQERREGAQLH